MEAWSMWSAPEGKPGFTVSRGRLQPAPGARFRETHPLDEQEGLFLIFVGLRDEPESYLAFADLYGALLVPGIRSIGSYTFAGPESETLTFWRSARAWMSHIRTVYSLAMDGEGMALAKMTGVLDVIGPGDDTFGAPGRDVLGEIAPDEPRGLPTLVDDAKHDEDVIGRAVKYVANQLDRELWRHTHPRLQVHRHGEARTWVFCPNLWCALVAQCYQSVLLNQSFRPCASCNKPMLLPPVGTPRERKTCSDACRKRIQRQRKA